MKKTVVYKTLYSWCMGRDSEIKVFNTREEQIRFENNYKNDTVETNKDFYSFKVTYTKRLFKKSYVSEELVHWCE